MAVGPLTGLLRDGGNGGGAAAMIDAGFGDAVFFGNSGLEAIECAIKTAHRYHHVNGEPNRIDVIGFAGSFRGRTYAAPAGASRQRVGDLP